MDGAGGGTRIRRKPPASSPDTLQGRHCEGTRLVEVGMLQDLVVDVPKGRRRPRAAAENLDEGPERIVSFKKGEWARYLNQALFARHVTLLLALG